MACAELQKTEAASHAEQAASRAELMAAYSARIASLHAQLAKINRELAQCQKEMDLVDAMVSRPQYSSYFNGAISAFDLGGSSIKNLRYIANDGAVLRSDALKVQKDLLHSLEALDQKYWKGLSSK